VLPLLAWHGRPRLPLRRIAAIVLLAGLIFPLGAYTGYAFAPTAHGAVLLAGCLPVATALIGWRLGLGRVDGRKAASLLGIVAGTTMLAVAGGAAIGAGAWRGDLCFVAATLAWGTFTVLAARWRLSALDAALAFGLCAAPLYLPVWWAFLPSQLGEVGWPVILFNLVFQGVISGVLNGIIYTQCVRTLGPGPTTMVGAMVPSLAASLAWPLLGEALAPLGIAGVLLVTGATVLGVVFPRTRFH
jgi:drug/metabolite transporter (DMT)-like permease